MINNGVGQNQLKLVKELILIFKTEDLIGDIVYQKINRKMKKYHIVFILKHLTFKELEPMGYFILHYMEKKE